TVGAARSVALGMWLPVGGGPVDLLLCRNVACAADRGFSAALRLHGIPLLGIGCVSPPGRHPERRRCTVPSLGTMPGGVRGIWNRGRDRAGRVAADVLDPSVAAMLGRVPRAPVGGSLGMTSLGGDRTFNSANRCEVRCFDGTWIAKQVGVHRPRRPQSLHCHAEAYPPNEASQRLRR